MKSLGAICKKIFSLEDWIGDNHSLTLCAQKLSFSKPLFLLSTAKCLGGCVVETENENNLLPAYTPFSIVQYMNDKSYICAKTMKLFVQLIEWNPCQISADI